MKVKKFNFGKHCGRSIVRPFSPDRLRLQFWRYYHPEDDARRKHIEKVVVTLDLTPGEAICAIQHLRRWLKDRVDAAQEDLDRGGRYRSGDENSVYRPPEE